MVREERERERHTDRGAERIETSEKNSLR